MEDKLDDKAFRFCLGCSHPLAGVTEARCPECGRTFDPLDERSTASSPYPVRRVLARIGKAAIGCMAVAAVGLALVNAWGGAWFLMEFMLAFMCAPVATVSVGFALIPRIPLSARWRMAAFAAPLLIASVLLTGWPFRLVFELHRGRLDAAVREIEAGNIDVPAGRMRIGMLTIVAIEQTPGGNLGFQLSGNRGGGVFLVHPSPHGTFLWFNPNWTESLGDGWWRVEQD